MDAFIVFGVRVDITSMGGSRDMKPKRLALAYVQSSTHFARVLVLSWNFPVFAAHHLLCNQSVCFPWKFENELAPISSMTATVAHADFSLKCL